MPNSHATHAGVRERPSQQAALLRPALPPWWLVALRGGAGIVFGLVALAMPGVTALSLTLVFAAYALLDGLLAVTAAVRGMQQHGPWGWLLLHGLLAIAAAVVAVFWPALTIVAFVLLLAAWAILSGGALGFVAAAQPPGTGRGWTAAAAIAALLFGVLLAVAPGPGAVLLVVWLGAYALLFGLAMLVGSLRLRTAQRPDAG